MKHQRITSSLLFSFLFIVFNGCTSQPLKIKEVFKPKNLAVEELQKSCLRGLTAACALLGKGSEAQQKHPILQGASSDTESTLVIQRSNLESLVYAFRRTDQTDVKEWIYPFFQTRSRAFSDVVLDHVHFNNLKPGKTYEILVFDSDGMLKDQRFFSSLPRNKKNAKVAIASCLNDHFKDAADKIWPELMSHKPDALFMIGDNTYTNQYTKNFGPATAEIIWNRYAETRQTLSVFYVQRLTPIFAVWDDHDFGRNDGDRTFEHREASRQVFLDFFPHDYKLKDYDRGEGVSSGFVAFGAQFLFMDDRFDRSPNGLKTADETHWGVENEKWLYEKLKKNRIPTFVIQGDQFFGGYHPYESYEGNHPNSFKNFLKKVKSTPQPIVFISGDRHLTEIIKIPKAAIGYQTYELTSSGIHSTRYADALKKNPSPDQLVGVAGEWNYMIVELKDVKKLSMQLLVESFGLDNKKFYSESLTVKK